MQEKHEGIEAICQHCEHEWVQPLAPETGSLQCPECGGCTAIEDMEELLDPPIHIVISRYPTIGTYLKVSTEVDRLYLAGILSEVMFMVNSSTAPTCRPEDCELKVIFSVERPKD